MTETSSVRPIIVFCGPSGSGKSTLVNQLMDEFKDCFAFSISHTTRKPRPRESDGKDYYFVSREEMQKAIENNEFVEHAEFSGNIYGTSKKAIKDVQASGRICILDIDVQGVKSMKKTDLKPKYIFVTAPSLKELEERLKGRGTETEESLAKRLDTAKAEMEYADQPGNFDKIIVNNDLDAAYAELKKFLENDILTTRPKNNSCCRTNENNCCATSGEKNCCITEKIKSCCTTSDEKNKSCCATSGEKKCCITEKIKSCCATSDEKNNSNGTKSEEKSNLLYETSAPKNKSCCITSKFSKK